MLLGDVGDEEPAVLLEATGDLDGDVLAGEVDGVELVDGRLHRGERSVDLSDELGDGDV